MGLHQNSAAEVYLDNQSFWRKALVLVAAIVCNCLVEGMCQSFPELYPIFLDEFKKAGSTRIVLIGSLLPGIYLVTSPFYCFMLRRFHFLVVMTTGSVISSAGLIGSSLASHGNHLIFCYTMLAGIGFGAIHLSCIVIISRTFKSYRGTAVAIILSASGFSGFIISPCTKCLVAWYGWRGANQIYGALFLNGIACGMIFNGVVQKTSSLKSVKTKIQRLYRRLASKDTVEMSFIIRQMSRERERIRENSSGSLDGFVITNDNLLVSASQAICAQQYFEETVSTKAEVNEILRESDCQNPSSVTEEEMSQNVIYKVIKSSGNNIVSIYSDRKPSCFELNEFFIVLQKASFILYSLSFITPFIASFMFIMNLPAHIFFTGLKADQSRVLLTSLWVLSSGFRVPVGFLCDLWTYFKFILHPSTLLTCGVLALALPWISSYGHQMVVTVFFGLFMASLVTLNPIFLMDMFGVKRFPQSYSISSFFQGLSTMMAPLLSRWIPLTHSTSFIVAGVMIAGAGLASLPLKWLRFREQETDENQRLLMECHRNVPEAVCESNRVTDDLVNVRQDPTRQFTPISDNPK